MRIALSGKMGAGKNTVYDMLKKLNNDLNELKFAKPLYDCAAKIQEELELDVEKDGKLMQMLGEYYRNKYGQNFFAQKLINNKLWHFEHYCITDLRSEVEYQTARQYGFRIIKIEREWENRKKHSLDRDPSHHTEIALDNLAPYAFDATINNDGGLDELEAKVSNLYFDIKQWFSIK